MNDIHSRVLGLDLKKEIKEVPVGLTNANIQLRNPRLPELEPVEVDALADTGSVRLCIPSHIQIQLKLEEIDKKEVTLAAGSRKLVPYVGPIELRASFICRFTLYS